MESPLPLLMLLCLLLLLSPPALGGTHLHLPSDRGQFDGGDGSTFTRWAVLVAGSNGFENYRHQADVCHAYQVLKRGGLKDENIIVFMYDDIAHHKDNPRPGVIINHPDGEDVYGGVPKDYVGDDVNVANFFAVLLGNKTALTGGSGKVIDSGPEDHIFIYYSDHGGPGVLGMPTNPNLYAVDLIEVLKMKHASGSYKSMVIYIEACESGSIFEGILPQGLNIYATTAANAVESSWGTYCPGDLPTPLPGFYSCLGDLYSVAWLEDSDSHNLQTETLRQQYHLVQARTAVHNTYDHGSHVMQFGDLQLSMNHIFSYIGSNPANENFTYSDDNALPSSSKAVNQRDADLLYFWNKYRHSADGSSGKWEAQRQLYDAMAHRLHLDNSLDLIGKLLFGSEQGPKVMNTIRPAGQPLADDWSCLKSLVRTFENHCGSLSQYGMKHMRSIANICNAGIHEETMGEVASQACRRIPSGHWGSLHRGFSA